MVKIVCIGQQGLDPQNKFDVFVVKVWIKSSFPHIVGNVSVGPLARRGLSSWILDIYYLFEVRYIEYRYGLLYTVIITENYNQFYHRPTLTQRSARRIDSHLGDAIQIISPSNQKSQHCRNIFWVKCWQLYHDRVFAIQIQTQASGLRLLVTPWPIVGWVQNSPKRISHKQWLQTELQPGPVKGVWRF